MKTLMQSFLPFTLLLITIVAGVVYFDGMAKEKSETFTTKSMVTPVATAPTMLAEQSN